ncbi:hypothetical protein [Bosea sp. NBC_00550]|uniref:hypothetical protein n=1 Tax=Bosea sp. NBC_00550 TaxID=2969621 RepID=UPI002231E0CA|nr:hypothetical protein [Bosea sp. NBC_00550]UZF93682.1 hypothetical protein NWE53_05640 [Bosea sp. NBC_00550]
MLKLIVHGLGAWFAVEAASGRYPRPVAVGLTMLVSRLGAPATAFAMLGYGLKSLREAGAFDSWEAPRARTTRPARARRPALAAASRRGAGRGSRAASNG